MSHIFYSPKVNILIEAIEICQEIYQKDFEIFGYSKLIEDKHKSFLK